MSEIPFTDPTPYVGLPPKAKFTDRDWFQALDQFARVFAIRPGERVLTTQLYFPNEPSNQRDGIFRPELVMQMKERGQGAYDFVVG